MEITIHYYKTSGKTSIRQGSVTLKERKMNECIKLCVTDNEAVITTKLEWTTINTFLV